jgi:cytochrome c5
MRRRIAVLIALLVIVGTIAAQCGGPPPATEAPAATKEPPATEAPAATEEPAATEAPAVLDGKALVEERCLTCHDLEARKTEEEWRALVADKIEKGVQLNQAEQEAVIEYLAETYPK